MSWIKSLIKKVASFFTKQNDLPSRVSSGAAPNTQENTQEIPMKDFREINEAALNLIKEFEGFYSKPYKDPVGIHTIGYGTIKYPNGDWVKLTDEPCTEAQALMWLGYEVAVKSKAINNHFNNIGLMLNDNQFGALASLAYNVGEGVILQPNRTMGSAILSKDHNKIADAFLVYVKAGGKTLKGLVRRREAEKKLYQS